MAEIFMLSPHLPGMRHPDGCSWVSTGRTGTRPVVTVFFTAGACRCHQDRTGAGKGDRGTLNALASPLSFRDIALFLLESQIITTYWHIESVLCLVSEDDSADLYKARFQGIHVYYTNKYNEEKLDFSISIKKNSGRMLLLGGG